jgi:putative PIN family toxin of toxin-antitoxin system
MERQRTAIDERSSRWNYRIVYKPRLLDELDAVLSRPKFASRLTQHNNIVRRLLVEDYSELADVVTTLPIDAITSRDADDDEVLACAISGDCEIIVTGDDDLLVLNEYRGIRILRTSALIEELHL